MRFTREVRDKLYDIFINSYLKSNTELGKVDWLEKRGYSILSNFGRFNSKTKKFNWGKQPRSSKSIFIFISESILPCNMRIRYYLNLPKDLAIRILILGYL
jgi:hypothetical protein